MAGLETALKSFEASTALENQPRISDAVRELLVKQIANELQSSQIYRAMSSWLDNAGWPSGTSLFMKYADEELAHMNKVINFLYDRNCKVTIDTVTGVIPSFKDVKSLLVASLEHEMKVTAQWELIAKTASVNGDFTTLFFTNWFLTEQVEEESKFRDAIYKLNLDMPKYEIEEMFKDMLG